MDEDDVAHMNSRDLEFKIFFSLPDDHLFDDFSCALQKGALFIQGRFYIADKHCCFGSIFSEKQVIINYSSIFSVEKRATAYVFQNAIEISLIDNLVNEQIFLTSFIYRDDAYDRLMAAWTDYKHNPRLHAHYDEPEKGTGVYLIPPIKLGLQRSDEEDSGRRSNRSGGGRSGRRPSTSDPSRARANSSAPNRSRSNTHSARAYHSTSSSDGASDASESEDSYDFIDAEGETDEDSGSLSERSMSGEEYSRSESDSDGMESSNSESYSDSGGPSGRHSHDHHHHQHQKSRGHRLNSPSTIHRDGSCHNTESLYNHSSAQSSNTSNHSATHDENDSMDNNSAGETQGELKRSLHRRLRRSMSEDDCLLRNKQRPLSLSTEERSGEETKQQRRSSHHAKQHHSGSHVPHVTHHHHRRHPSADSQSGRQQSKERRATTDGVALEEKEGSPLPVAKVTLKRSVSAGTHNLPPHLSPRATDSRDQPTEKETPQLQPTQSQPQRTATPKDSPNSSHSNLALVRANGEQPGESHDNSNNKSSSQQSSRHHSPTSQGTMPSVETIAAILAAEGSVTVLEPSLNGDRANNSQSTSSSASIQRQPSPTAAGTPNNNASNGSNGLASSANWLGSNAIAMSSSVARDPSLENPQNEHDSPQQQQSSSNNNSSGEPALSASQSKIQQRNSASSSPLDHNTQPGAFLESIVSEDSTVIVRRKKLRDGIINDYQKPSQTGHSIPFTPSVKSAPTTPTVSSVNLHARSGHASLHHSHHSPAQRERERSGQHASHVSHHHQKTKTLDFAEGGEPSRSTRDPRHLSQSAQATSQQHHRNRLIERVLDSGESNSNSNVNSNAQNSKPHNNRNKGASDASTKPKRSELSNRNATTNNNTNAASSTASPTSDSPQSENHVATHARLSASYNSDDESGRSKGSSSSGRRPREADSASDGGADQQHVHPHRRASASSSPANHAKARRSSGPRAHGIGKRLGESSDSTLDSKHVTDFSTDSALLNQLKTNPTTLERLYSFTKKLTAYYNKTLFTLIFLALFLLLLSLFARVGYLERALILEEQRFSHQVQQDLNFLDYFSRQIHQISLDKPGIDGDPQIYYKDLLNYDNNLVNTLEKWKFDIETVLDVVKKKG